MIYVLLFLSVSLLVWGVLVYVRKSLWDTVHRNLLDLEDHYEGRVIRRSFLARPYFFGRMNGFPLMVNFSSQKNAGQRLNYVTISYGIPAKEVLTLSNIDWLENQDAGELGSFKSLPSDPGGKLVIKVPENEAVPSLFSGKEFGQFSALFSDLAYIFINKNGILYEFLTEQAARETEFKQLNQRLLFLQYLGEHTR